MKSRNSPRIPAFQLPAFISFLSYERKSVVYSTSVLSITRSSWTDTHPNMPTGPRLYTTRRAGGLLLYIFCLPVKLCGYV